MIALLLFRLACCVLAVAVVWRLYRRSSRWSHFKSAAIASSTAAVFAVLATALSANGLESYGIGLFVLTPFAAGFLSVLIHSVNHPITRADAAVLPLTVMAASTAIIGGFAIEGFICLAMGSPLLFGLVALGVATAFGVLEFWQWFRQRHATRVMLTTILLGVPGAIEVEARLPRAAPTYEVSTSADIDAPPPVVWQAVIAPSKLPKPTHPIFRAGIAYPLAAHIEGSGRGATRYCNFSTGNLVEPVLQWDEPRLLRFSVISNPQPMQEWTLYGQIHPPHLDGFLVSRQGEFRLEPLPGGRTRLIATTWYQHNLYPAAYWRLWSDYILHRVHDVVLDNISAKARAAHQMRDASSTNPGRTGSPETVLGSASTTGSEPGR